MQIKKHVEKTYVKEVVQYVTADEFYEDYKKRIKSGWKIAEPYYSKSLTFVYEKLKDENVLLCDAALD